jgi:hypothetical protein
MVFKVEARPSVCAGAVARSKCGGGPESALGSKFRPTLFFLELFLLGEQKKKRVNTETLSINNKPLSARKI